MRIYVNVVPRASRNKIEKQNEGQFKVWLTAPPVGGAANKALLELLSKHFGVAKSCIEIVGGRTARTKIVDVET